MNRNLALPCCVWIRLREKKSRKTTHQRFINRYISSWCKMFFTCGQEAIAQKLSDTRSLLGTARRLRATVADAEFAAWTARQRAGDVGPSVEERAVWKEALARIRGVPPEAQAGWMRRWWWRNFDDDALCFPCVEVEVQKHASCWRCWVGCNGWWHLGGGSWFKDIFQDQWERGDGFARKTDSRLYTLN